MLSQNNSDSQLKFWQLAENLVSVIFWACLPESCKSPLTVTYCLGFGRARVVKDFKLNLLLQVCPWLQAAVLVHYSPVALVWCVWGKRLGETEDCTDTPLMCINTMGFVIVLLFILPMFSTSQSINCIFLQILFIKWVYNNTNLL